MSEATYKHLQDYVYYDELYDKFTIEECLRWEEASDEREPEKINVETDADKLNRVKRDFQVKVFLPTALYFVKGERYKNKSTTINEWMSRDRALDEKVASATEPKGIRCLNCSHYMDCISRDLHSDGNHKKKVLFFFTCPRCGKHRAYWEGGQEWEPNPTLCPKCKTKMQSASSRQKNIVTTVDSCPKCHYQQNDVWDLDEKTEKPVDPNFEANRKKYCLSPEEGGEYISQTERLKQLSEHLKFQEDNKESYTEVAKLQKLTIAQVRELLTKALAGKKFSDLHFAQPELGKYVTVKFNCMEADKDRKEYDSRMALKKLIDKELNQTNWRLMSEGINYRLGYLTGRLKAYEDEADLISLVKVKN